MAVLPPDPVFCLKSDMSQIQSLCFPETNDDLSSKLLAATESGFVYFWSLETNRQINKQKLGTSIQAIHYLDSHDIITLERPGEVKLWKLHDTSSYELSKTYLSRGGYCRGILINDHLIVPQEDSKLDIVNVKTLTKDDQLIPNLTKLGLAMCIQHVQLAGKSFILGGYESGDVILWNYGSRQACGHLKLPECITSLFYDGVSGRGICANVTNTLQLFTIDQNFNITLKCEIPLNVDGCGIVKLRPDRKIFVCGGPDGSLRLFSWKSLRLLAVLNEHKAPITDVQFSPRRVGLWEAPIMAAAGADGVISLWNLYN